MESIFSPFHRYKTHLPLAMLQLYRFNFLIITIMSEYSTVDLNILQRALINFFSFKRCIQSKIRKSFRQFYIQAMVIG